MMDPHGNSQWECIMDTAGFFRYLVNCWVSGLYIELVKGVYKQTTLGTQSSFQYLLALW